MSQEMEHQDAEVMAVANGERPAKPKAEGRKGKFLAKAANESVPNNANRWREFGPIAVEVGGYAGMGILMLTAMMLQIAPQEAAVPIFTGCFIWVAIRVDRFFRRG